MTYSLESAGHFALAKVDDTNVTLRLDGIPWRALMQPASIVVGWQGTLSPSRGGLGLNGSAANGVPLFTSGAVSFVPLPAGGSGSGDVTGPAGAVTDNIATYNDATGKVLKDGGKKVGDLAALTQVVRYDTAQSLTTNQMAQARSNIAVTKRNYIINGAFQINQGVYVSGAVLAAAAYGHDQWKAGASGGDYSFTQSTSLTTITIAAGKSLIQPIEDVRVTGGGSYVLSWTGTAQARAGVNTLTPAGSYAASPLLITGQTDGTVMSVEFNAGTLGNVGLYEGTVAPPFQMPDYADELVACQRYYIKKGYGITGYAAAGTQIGQWYNFSVAMRAAPTQLFTGWGAVNSTGPGAFDQITTTGFRHYLTALASGTASLDNGILTLTARL